MKNIKNKVVLVKKEKQKKTIDKKKKVIYNIDRKELLKAFQNKKRTTF
jgi:hypothetical protein